MKHLIWTDPTTGRLNVLTPAYNDKKRSLILPNHTDDELLERCRQRSVPQGVESFIIDDSVPQIAAFLGNRVNRNAWMHTDGVLGIDVSKLP